MGPRSVLGQRPAALSSEPADAPARREKRGEPDKEPPKPDFELIRQETRPGLTRLVKPGHWSELRLEYIAHNFDFPGELWTGAERLPGMPYQVRAVRPAFLPKGQRKGLEVGVFLGRHEKTFPLELGLYRRRGGLAESTLMQLEPAPPHQFFLLLLAREPERYSFLRELASVSPSLLEARVPDSPSRHYRVAFPSDPEGPAPVSSHPLTWSTTAYILWDGYEPNQLSAEQQQALVDWLHWGGQLIITGHSSLLGLKESFLAPYLPADADETVELSALPELQQQFPGPKVIRAEASRILEQGLAVREQQPTESSVVITPKAPLVASRLKVRPDVGQSLLRKGDEGEVLVAERRVGRGRVVVCAFRLAERPLTAWRGFDHFFNALLLRRPGRVPLGTLAQPGAFSGERLSAEAEALGWQNGIWQPRLISQVRYFTRDVRSRGNLIQTDQPSEPSTASDEGQPLFSGYGGLGPSDWPAFTGPRAAEWDDRNVVSELARRLLHTASGITIPRPWFVLQVVLAYVALLVPINWLVFRTLRRVELAWAAAPCISLGFAVFVLELSHLNIGFQRAVNEVHVVEAYGGYPRAHVTRYTAVYTSMRSRYRFSYADPTTVVLPFPTAASSLRGQEIEAVVFRWDNPVQLEQMLLHPNSLGMVHAEQMFDMRGAFMWRPDGGGETTKPAAPTTDSETGGVEKAAITNGSSFDLDGGLVLSPWGEARLGALEAGATVVAAFDEANRGSEGSQPSPPVSKRGAAPTAGRASKGLGGQWSEDRLAPDEILGTSARADAATAQRDEAELRVDPLVELARATCPEDEVRLIGWSRSGVPGQEIQPPAGRHRVVTLFVVHLRPAPLPPPGKDADWTMVVPSNREDL